jgi:hypothetical protein
MNANFCTECGQPLIKLDWSLSQERVVYLSCGAHYFELVKGGFDCVLKQLTPKECTVCGAVIPYLKDWQGEIGRASCRERV